MRYVRNLNASVDAPMLRASQVIARRCRLAVCGQSERNFLREPRYSTVSNVELEDIDVAIVGGGPAGLALACALCQSDLPSLMSCKFILNE